MLDRLPGPDRSCKDPVPFTPACPPAAGRRPVFAVLGGLRRRLCGAVQLLCRDGRHDRRGRAEPAGSGGGIHRLFFVLRRRAGAQRVCLPAAFALRYDRGGARISHILRNPFYKGAHLVFRTHQKGIRSNTYDISPRDQWEVIEGCHEAIVTPEEWEQVQELIDRRPTIQGNSCPFYNLFHGLVYCATCGKSMQVRYEKVGRTGKNRFTGEMREPIDKAYYICQTYNRMGCKVCSSHKIEARDLYNLVLKDIQELAAQAMKDADAFYQRLSSRMERRYLVDASQTEKERQRLEARNQEIDGMFLSLYTDKAKGILTEQRFVKLTAALEQEQESNQKRLHDLTMMQSRADAQESEVRTFIKEIRRYATIEELDEAVLNRLISRILIGEVKKVDGQKVQEVRIVYNFVGEIPEIAA